MPQRQLCDAEAKHPAHTGEQHLLDDCLRDEAATAGAERCPDRHVARTGQRPRKRQVGEVRARDQQHRADGAHQEQEATPRAADDRIH
jgi:hypothetical protein